MSVNVFDGASSLWNNSLPNCPASRAGLLAIKLLLVNLSNHELRRCNLGSADGEGCRPGAFWNH